MSYGIIYSDPPWPQQKGNIRKCRPNQGRQLDYKTMSLPDIIQYHKEAFLLLDKKANVFLWTIDKFLPETEQFMADLGFKLHARMIWDKGNGIAPAFTVRFSHEYLLWFYREGQMLKPRIETRGKYTTVFRENSTLHSRKPVCVYEMIEDMFPDAEKLELFSRNHRNGWVSIGDEVDKFD